MSFLEEDHLIYFNFLLMAKLKKGTDLMKYLINKGADVNARGGLDMGITPLHECALFGKTLNEHIECQKYKFLRLKLG